MADTAIEWTDQVWNPTTGCDRISPGCDHCYALTLAKRLKAMGSGKYQVDGNPRTSGPGFGVTVHESAMLEPLRWRTPRKVFVNSMSDVGHAQIPRAALARIWAVMALTGRGGSPPSSPTRRSGRPLPSRRRSCSARGRGSVGSSTSGAGASPATPEWVLAGR